MCEGSESELPGVDEEPTSGSESSELYTPTIGDPSATIATASSSPPTCQSARIESLRAGRSSYATSVIFEIAASKSHWTDLDSDEEPECPFEDNLKYFESLQLRRSWIVGSPPVRDPRNLVVGKKIAEGGQAEIYEAEVQGLGIDVVKVFREGYSVRSLIQQLPPELLEAWQKRGYSRPYFNVRSDQICGVFLLNDKKFSNRFAFVMRQVWGDLRKLFDLRMLNCNRKRRYSPPFFTTEAT